MAYSTETWTLFKEPANDSTKQVERSILLKKNIKEDYMGLGMAPQ